ncbi:cytochrome b562 family protein [Escherichia coli]|uniref:cytochrome b562 n=1 Tax=Escherichia coli TaxID=562 RepID=UPI0004521047|nr:cytochrome b562 [Escherichia coli]EEZ5888957.1 cytochrome b562 family protein [Escherichia coli O146]EKF4762541.1 cytochrome b562 family protein [Escherichia coli O113]EKK2501893.1 cytochrome b562 family protein [Escherichia coli O142]EKK2569537.1 cytochrome b562 family protein [Escherichia coli O103]EKK2711877.1 cytochrome b562 family protein [Escherichia coli O121]EKK2834723.1 cytochrome b562 family protein [Escherichia coli O33]ELJ0539034.1 cytochrome b562 family protein [Escherichia c
MKNTKIIMISGIMALYMLGTTISYANSLADNMQILAENLSVLQSSTDKNELLTALDLMNKAVDESMNILPVKLSPDDKKGADDYINGLKMLKNEIGIIRESISNGNLSNINDSVSKINNIRIENHKKFR